MNPASAMAIVPSSSSSILLRRSTWNVFVAAPATIESANNAPQLSQRRNASTLLLGHHQTLPLQNNNNLQQNNHPSSSTLFPSYYNFQKTQTRQFARKTTFQTSRFKKRHHPNAANGQKFDKYSFEDLDNHTKQKRDNKNILVIGSSGALGKKLVSYFGHSCNWNVIGADVLDPAAGADDGKGLRDYIQLPKEGSIGDLTGDLYRGVSHLLNPEGSPQKKSNEEKLDAIVCASGGWAGDVDFADMMESHLVETAVSSELEDLDVEEKYARESAEVCERMMRVNYFPIVAGSQVGRRFMRRGGLFCTIGASAALSPTPGMVGYGSAKSAAHHYLQSWGPKLLEENDINSVAILPLMIDTPMNRDMLGDDGEDERYSKMVKPIHIANEIGEWLKQPELMPHAGSLVKVIAKNRRDGSGGAAFHLVR